MRTLILAVALAAVAAADDAIVQRWDNPKRESFDLKALSPQQAAEEVAKRYGVAVKVEAQGAAADFAATDVTFLEALDRLAAIHGLVLSGAPGGKKRGWGEPRPLTLVRPPEGVRPVPAVYLGGSRLSVQGVCVVATLACAPEPEEDEMALRLGGPSRDDATPGLGVRLRWIAEPGLETMGRFGFEVVTAEDDTGQRLAVKEERLWRTLEWHMPANRDFIVQLDNPSPKARAIRKLEGRLKVAIPIERASVEFAANDVGQAKPLGAAQVTLESIDADAKTLTISMKGAPCAGFDVGYPDLLVGPDDHVWRGAWAANAIQICPYGADGRGIEEGEDGTDRNLDDDKWTAKISLKAVPAKITVEALVRAAVREASFSFKDIPLPE
jgi:hypothetical protein